MSICIIFFLTTLALNWARSETKWAKQHPSINIF